MSNPPIKPLTISIDGVQKLLLNLNVKKASGPDNISCRILRELSMELAPVLAAIYTQSIESGEVPIDWTQALVTPIFNKSAKGAYMWSSPVCLSMCEGSEHTSLSVTKGKIILDVRISKLLVLVSMSGISFGVYINNISALV